MRVSVRRIQQGKESTLSEIYIDEEFCCYGLEDAVRELKIKGCTAIPAGCYTLGLNHYGAMNARFKRQFPDWHQGMIEICGIPNFSCVYIHIGNYITDTEGCILVGDYFKCTDGEYAVYSSTVAYQRLYQRLLPFIRIGELVIEVRELSVGS